MGKFTLDELECDEIHAALVERRADLNKRKTKLLEDSLPEAADGIEARLRLYGAHEGPDRHSRVGLVRMFAPQKDLEAEADQARREEQRDPAGQQDIFGGGAETGGRRKAKAKAEPVDYEIIPEGRRISSKSTLTVESALRILAHMARHLLAGPVQLDDVAYDHYAGIVVACLPAMYPTIDPEYLRNHVAIEIRGALDNAHALAHFVNRNVDAIRDLRENPPAPKAAEPVFVELDAEALAALTAEELADYEAKKAKAAEVVPAIVSEPDAPLPDAAADALRSIVFPPEAPASNSERDADGGLSFETPADRGDAPTGDAKPAEGKTEPDKPAGSKPPRKKRSTKKKPE